MFFSRSSNSAGGSIPALRKPYWHFWKDMRTEFLDGHEISRCVTTISGGPQLEISRKIRCVTKCHTISAGRNHLQGRNQHRIIWDRWIELFSSLRASMLRRFRELRFSVSLREIQKYLRGWYRNVAKKCGSFFMEYSLEKKGRS